MYFSPVHYEEPLFRPPAEAYSAIVQATIGCSWNQCAFCEMYTSKKFRARPMDEVLADVSKLADHYRGSAKKVFLADGNAFVLSAARLTQILEHVQKEFGRIQRVACYASSRDILAKSDQELLQLRERGLKLLYVGIETGDDELLQRINKGETYQTTLEGISRAHNAGIDTSIMILNGLGGKLYAQQHAINSARIINALNPKFLSTLTLSMPYGEEHFKGKFKGEYQQQTVVEIMQELRLFIEHLEVENVIYRSNHVSNNLILAGTLSRDKDDLLQQIDTAIAATPSDLMPLQSGAL